MSARPHGFLTLVLHAHLPFVRHPEHPVFLEENWLFEAITECYVPLAERLGRLADDGADARLAMSLSPPLCEMLSDELLRERYLRHLGALIELTEKEMDRTRHEPAFHRLAIMYNKRLSHIRDLYDGPMNRDLVGAFKSLQDAGTLEIVSCAATHAFLPLIRNPRALRAQLRMGVRNYRRHFDRDPAGIWLPECAYVPGLDQELAAERLRYFFLDSHGVLFGSPRPRYGTFAPVYCRSHVAAFARDIESSKQVWSAQTGYPGDPVYREFYRDLGYDADFDYIEPYLYANGSRHDVGLKYFRVTGEVALSDKDVYDPDDAAAKVDEHTAHFVHNRQSQARHMNELLGRPPLMVAPYDAELFGHWWYEGPDFLGAALERLSRQNDVRTITPSEYLAEFPTLQIIEPSASSWGDKGYFEVWLNGSNDWIYRHLHEAEDRMCRLVDTHATPNPLTHRALNQAARELMLAQSSDWAFIMTTGTMSDYAAKRVSDHIARFNRLHEMIEASRIAETELAKIEHMDNIFPDMDYTIYAG